MKHAEPLLIWKLERKLSKIKTKVSDKLIEAWNKENEDKMSEKNIPPEIKKTIVHFYTKRQTCNRCEKLIQRSAHNFDYVPIISFSELYLSDSGGENDRVCEVFGKTKYHLSFSKLKKDDEISTRFLTKQDNSISVKDFLNKKYPVDTSIKFNEFDKNNKNIKNLFSYKKHINELEGIERFPIQFHTSSN